MCILLVECSEWIDSFTARPFYHAGKGPTYESKLGESQRSCSRSEEEETPVATVMNQNPGWPDRS
jgi:hypothetical protein